MGGRGGGGGDGGGSNLRDTLSDVGASESHCAELLSHLPGVGAGERGRTRIACFAWCPPQASWVQGRGEERALGHAVPLTPPRNGVRYTEAILRPARHRVSSVTGVTEPLVKGVASPPPALVFTQAPPLGTECRLSRARFPSRRKISPRGSQRGRVCVPLLPQHPGLSPTLHPAPRHPCWPSANWLPRGEP